VVSAQAKVSASDRDARGTCVGERRQTETDVSLRTPTATVQDSSLSSTIMSPWTLSDALGYISICCWLGAQFPSVKTSDCVVFTTLL